MKELEEMKQALETFEQAFNRLKDKQAKPEKVGGVMPEMMQARLTCRDSILMSDTVVLSVQMKRR